MFHLISCAICYKFTLILESELEVCNDAGTREVHGIVTHPKLRCDVAPHTQSLTLMCVNHVTRIRLSHSFEYHTFLPSS